MPLRFVLVQHFLHLQIEVSVVKGQSLLDILM